MLSQAQACELFERNGFFIVQGLPRGSYVALDGHSAVTDHGFEGYKFVPPGVHLFVWRAEEEDIGMRSVFIHYFDQGSVVLRIYDALSDTWSCDTNLLVSRDHLRSLDTHLASYPFPQLRNWQSLTHNIAVSKNTIERIFTGECDSFTAIGSDRASLNMTQFDLRRSWPPNATGAERTQWSIDKSWLLAHVLQEAAGDAVSHTALLAEFELCFVLALYANNAATLEHWAAIHSLFCRSSARIGAPSYHALHPCEWDDEKTRSETAKPNLDAHIAFMHTLNAQLNELPDDAWTHQLAEQEAGIVDDLLQLQRSIGRALGAWAATKRVREEPTAEPPFDILISEWRALCNTGRRWGWHLGAELDEEAEAASETDEDAPVVVY